MNEGLVALIVSVEISDQMGTSETILVGVYNDCSKLIQDKAATDRKFSTRRRTFKEVSINVNQSIIGL